MKFSLKDKLFSLFSSYDKNNDDNGLLKRFNELVGDDFDKNELNKAQNIFDLCMLAEKCDVKLLSTLENLLGIPFITQNVTHRRKIVQNIFDIYKNKGNNISYNILFCCLEYGKVTLEKLNNNYDYNLRLLSFSSPLTDYDLKVIINANNLLEPLYTGIFSIESDKKYDSVFVEIIANGDLTYISYLDVKLILQDNGDLFIMNNTNYTYSLRQNGDLVKN